MNIVVDNVTKTFGNTNVIEDISMEMQSGHVYGFQGINGCGKTMLMRLISGLIHPTKGQILIDGEALHGENSFPKSMGLLIENPAFLNIRGIRIWKCLPAYREKLGKRKSFGSWSESVSRKTPTRSMANTPLECGSVSALRAQLWNDLS